MTRGELFLWKSKLARRHMALEQKIPKVEANLFDLKQELAQIPHQIEVIDEKLSVTGDDECSEGEE